MSDNLDRLLTAEQLAACRAADARMDTQKANLMQTNGELSARITQLEYEIAVLRGVKAPPLPRGSEGFIFDIKAGDSLVWCLALNPLSDEPQRFSTRYTPQCPEVVSLWINGAWVSTEELGSGALTLESLDAAAEQHLKNEWQASCDSIAEERSFYEEQA